jgi:hypothetical protein
VALNEHNVFFGVKAACDIYRERFERAAAEVCGVLAHRDGVHIRNAVEAVIFAAVLKRLPVFDSSEVVAYCKVAAGLNGGKYSLFIFRKFHLYFSEYKFLS